MTDRPTVHVVDDDEAVRRSLAYTLRTAGHVVHTWPSGEAFLDGVEAEPACVLLDVRMPGIDGLAVQRELAARGLAFPVIVMTGHGDIATAVQAMKGGAIDFLEKPFESINLRRALTTAAERLAAAEGHQHRLAEAEARLRILTPREREVLDALARGLPNKTIAWELGISARTVEVHRANVMSKLELSTLSDVLRIAFAAGMGL
jgi:two-component system response regulator FixJ